MRGRPVELSRPSGRSEEPQIRGTLRMPCDLLTGGGRGRAPGDGFRRRFGGISNRAAPTRSTLRTLTHVSPWETPSPRAGVRFRDTVGSSAGARTRASARSASIGAPPRRAVL